ncbi:hypothetical protein OC834_002501 [Tilletia horrida]|nr:hypothetical protein OC834_002501 [Tilletia horrida]
MSLADMDHLGRGGNAQDPSRRQSQAESISTLWSSADVPLFLDTRPSLSAISEHKSGLDAPISLGPNGPECSEDVREVLSEQGSSPAMMSDSTPRSSFDPIPAFPGTNSSPSSFAASRYGRKQSQDSPRRRPPPLQLQSSNAFMNMEVPQPPLPASQSHTSQLTMVPNARQEVPSGPPSASLVAPSPRTSVKALPSEGLPATPSMLPYHQPVVQQRRSSLKKQSSNPAFVVPEQPMPPVLSPAVRSRLYARADQFFQADYSLASPVSKQQMHCPPASETPMSAPATAAFVEGPGISLLSRKSSTSLSSEALSRDNSMPGSLSFSHGSTISGSTASSCFISSEDSQSACSPAGPSYSGAWQHHHLPAAPGAAFVQAQAQAAGLHGMHGGHPFAHGQFGKPAKVRDPTMTILPGQMYAVLPPTPQRAFHSQQASPAFAPPMPSAGGVRHRPSAAGEGMEPSLRLPMLSTQYLGAALNECTPMVQSPIALPTPVSSFSETSEVCSGEAPRSSSHASLADNQPPQAPQWSYSSPSVSPTQPITVDRARDTSLRLRTASASRLLHAASMKLLRTENMADAPPLPLPKGFPKGQRPSTATTDGCNLRPRARTVGEKERPVSLQPAARIPEKVGSDSFMMNGPAVRSPQGSLIPPSTMTSAAVTGKPSLSFRPKSKGGWASHLSGGLTLHVDQDSQRSVQINLSYLSYDPFGRAEALVPATTEGARPATPKRSKAGLKAEDEESTGILEFGPMQGVDDGWVFQSSSPGGTSTAPILRHLTVGPELKADVLTRQAKLSLCTDGVHEVSGSEKKGKLGWRFMYRVEPCLDSVGRAVASGEKIMRPLKFLCSATLLEPSRAQKSRLINLVRKQVNANLISTPVRSPASASSQTEITTTSSSSSMTVPSPLAASSRMNPLKSIQLQHHRQPSMTPSHSQQYLIHQQQQTQPQQQQQQPSSSLVSQTQTSTSAAGMPEPQSATHSLRAQFSPYNLTFANSSTSLVSPSVSSSVVAAVQRLDPSQVSVPANLPAGVVPFKLVRPLGNKASVSSFQQAAPASAPVPGPAPVPAVVSAVQEPSTRHVSGNVPSEQGTRSASAAHQLPVRTNAVEANNSSTSPPAFQQRLPFFGEKPVEVRKAALQPSPLAPSAAVAPLRSAQAELAGREEAFAHAADYSRRMRAHTSGETKLRRPMTASELIKREWESKQRDEEGSSTTTAAAAAAGVWTAAPPPCGRDVAAFQAQRNAMFRPCLKDASSPISPAPSSAGLRSAMTCSSASGSASKDVAVLTPEFFGTGSERRRSRTIGASGMGGRGNGRPYTAQPLASAQAPPLPHSATALQQFFHQSQSHQQHQHQHQPALFRPAPLMQDGRYPARPGTGYGSGASPYAAAFQPATVVDDAPQAFAMQHANPSMPYHVAGLSGSSTVPGLSMGAVGPATTVPAPAPAPAPAVDAAASALLRQMPTTIVQPPLAGSAPVPPKRNQRRPRTAQTPASASATAEAAREFYYRQQEEVRTQAQVEAQPAVAVVGLGPPGTPMQHGQGPPRSGSFGVSPLVNFSPQKVAA